MSVVPFSQAHFLSAFPIPMRGNESEVSGSISLAKSGSRFP